MSSPDVQFGVFIPQGWKMELSGITGAEAKWAKAVEIAQLAESTGYDSVWVYDHFHNVPTPAHEAVFECWTVMAAISQLTSRVRLGQMVGCAPYRNPGLLAKITSTIDVISGGRLDWGVGAGWYEHEFRGYGYEFPAPKERIGALRETVEIVKLLWSEPEVKYEGRYFQLDGAQCDPKPLQDPHPPIWIGGGGEQLTLRVVARHADRSNFGGKPHEFEHKCEVLKEHCAAVGRDYDEITKTISSEVFVRETEAEIEEAGSQSRWGEPFDSWRAGNFVGTPEQVSEKIQTYIDLGCTGFVPWCSDYPDDRSLRLFAEKVIPNFR
ncbi:MAG TPA: LLM class F420-dependent oxidoreductase [Acidimicrobiales bacterium]|nr:LLM class F420-dependent oxidoreductase [Acidimicrobiales bacterium]